MGPMRIRVVRDVTAASATHGSCTGTAAPATNAMWSHRKNPSHPARSASTPSEINVSRSPMFGTVTP